MKILDKVQSSENNLKKEMLLPLVPLKDMVLFPYLAVPLYIGRKFSVEAIKEALK